jgi:hypothetical protein
MMPLAGLKFRIRAYVAEHDTYAFIGVEVRACA